MRSACLIILFVLAHSFNHHTAADKPTWEDMTEAQQKIKLRQELTSSEFEGMAIT